MAQAVTVRDPILVVSFAGAFHLCEWHGGSRAGRPALAWPG
jgi:hypothetical protein